MSMQNMIVIGDHAPEAAYATPDGFSTGLDLSPRPFEGMAYGGVAEPFPDNMIIPRAEWGDRIEEIRKQGSGIREQMQAAGIPVKDQNGTSYCWINAPTFCVEIVRMQQGDKHVSLSPASAGARIKNFRNQGGWGKEGLEFIAEHGLCPSDKWPDNGIKRQYATAENIALAKQYRVDEWWELEPRNLDHMVSAILRRKPVAVGYNWWRHEVTALGLVWTGSPENVQLLIGNSWGTQWSDKGYGILEGRKRLADDAVCPRTVLAS